MEDDDFPIDNFYPVEIIKRDIAPFKAAVVNKTTNIVEEIILLNHIKEYKKPGYDVVEIKKKEVSPPQPKVTFISSHNVTRMFRNRRPLIIEYPVIPGSTRWEKTKGFYEV